MSFKNPVIKYHRGKPVRRYNQIQIRVNEYEWIKFIDAKLDFGMDALQAIKSKKALCEVCNGVEIRKMERHNG